VVQYQVGTRTTVYGRPSCSVAPDGDEGGTGFGNVSVANAFWAS
jgi:hypothetical protein